MLFERKIDVMKYLSLCVFAIILFSFVGCGSTSTNLEIEENISSNIDSEEASSEKEFDEISLSENDYKALCQEMFYDDFFESEVAVGTYVKFYGFTSQKFKYGATDVAGILVEDITEEYNLEWNCLGSCILHEETKDDSLPNYFGESVYLMFEKEGTYNLDSFSTGEYIIVYGKVIQTVNGVYILPKYIEYQ